MSAGALATWRSILAWCGVPFAVLALIGLCASSTWLGALALHLGEPSLLPMLLLVAIAPGWRLRSLLLTGAVAVLAPWLLALAEVPCAPAPSAASFTVASLNCYDFNRDRPALRAGVAALTVDIAALQEVTNADEAPIAERFPNRVWPHGDDLFRTALVSRFPIRSSRIHSLEGYACIEAVVATPAGDVRVFAGHLHSPLLPWQRESQRRQFRQLAGLVAGAPGPVLVLADCNATPADPLWRSFCRDARLQRPPWLWPGSWPSWLGPLGLPIDHVLGRGVALGRLHPVPLPGSDHRGVMAAVQLP